MPLKTVFKYDTAWVLAEEKKRYNHVRVVKAVKQIRRHRKQGSILDIGCGVGLLVDALSAAGFSAAGVDTSVDAIKYAQETKRGTFYLWDGLRADMFFDVITAAHVIEHVRDPVGFLDSLRVRLKPGGLIYLETPNLRSFSSRVPWRKSWGGMHGGLDHRILYTPGSLRKVLDAAGFDVLQLQTWTYSTRLYDSFVNTFRAAGKVAAQRIGSTGVPAGREVSGEHFVRKKSPAREVVRFLNALSNRVSASRITELFLWLPNRTTEICNRGVQINCIARRRN